MRRFSVTQHQFRFAAATILLLACGKGEPKPVVAADAGGRDLQLAPVDTMARLSDVAAPADSAPVPSPVAAAPVETVVVYRDAPPAAAAPRPRPAPAPKPAAPGGAPPPAVGELAAPAPAPKRQLAEATVINAVVIDTISSRSDSAGQRVKVRVAEPVTDPEGRTVIPAGSIVTLRIEAIKWSENKKDKGTLRMSTENVRVDGARFPLVGSVSTPAFTYKHRGSSAGDVAKVAGGAGAGAIVGGLIGKGTGAVIGGVVGGAVGAQRMSQTKDNDIFVVPGSALTITLNETFTR
jgi:hypothetical protein